MTGKGQKFRITKDPNAVLDYTFDWSDWLIAGDSISNSTWEADSDDIEIDSDSHVGDLTTVWLSGGIDRRVYTVTNHIVTDDGREEDRSLEVHMRQR